MRRVRRRTVRRRPCKACIAALAHGNDRQQRPSLGRPSLLKVCRRLGCIICPDLLQGGTEQGGVMWKGQQNASASDSPPRSHPAPHWQAALSRRGRGKLGVPVLPSSNAWPGHKGRQQPKHHPVTCLHHNQPPAVACGEHLLAVGHHLQGSRQGLALFNQRRPALRSAPVSMPGTPFCQPACTHAGNALLHPGGVCWAGSRRSGPSRHFVGQSAAQGLGAAAPSLPSRRRHMHHPRILQRWVARRLLTTQLEPTTQTTHNPAGQLTPRAGWRGTSSSK